MLLDPAAKPWVSGRTRLLTYALLGYCATMVLLGPSVAEFFLGAFGCAGRMGSVETGCGGLALLPASVLAPWLSAVPPVETLFLLMQQTWLLGAGWLALIMLSVYFDQRQGPPAAVPPETLRANEPSAAATAASASFAVQQADWVRQKEAEQTQQQRIDELSLHRRILLEGGLWGSLLVVLALLIGGLAAFCLALGMPLVGGMGAESLMQTFSCSDRSLMDANPWSGVCGLLIERLAPYHQPWIGALYSPIWLFTQFSDVLLIWMAAILLVVLLFVYRLGWSTVLEKTSLPVKVGGLVVFNAALLGQLYGLAEGARPPVYSDGGIGGLAGALPMVFTLAAVVLVVLVLAVIALIVFAIYLARQFQKRGQAHLPP